MQIKIAQYIILSITLKNQFWSECEMAFKNSQILLFDIGIFFGGGGIWHCILGLKVLQQFEWRAFNSGIYTLSFPQKKLSGVLMRKLSLITKNWKAQLKPLH